MSSKIVKDREAIPGVALNNRRTSCNSFFGLSHSFSVVVVALLHLGGRGHYRFDVALGGGDAWSTLGFRETLATSPCNWVQDDRADDDNAVK